MKIAAGIVTALSIAAALTVIATACAASFTRKFDHAIQPM